MVYLGLAVTVFNNPEVRQHCTAVDVVVKDSDVAGFITPSEIRMLLREAKVYPIGKNERNRLRTDRKCACEESVYR